jgi:hypothetical protein
VHCEDDDDGEEEECCDWICVSFLVEEEGEGESREKCGEEPAAAGVGGIANTGLGFLFASDRRCCTYRKGVR